VNNKKKINSFSSRIIQKQNKIVFSSEEEKFCLKQFVKWKLYIFENNQINVKIKNWFKYKIKFV